MLTAIKNAIVINKNAKKYRNFVFYRFLSFHSNLLEQFLFFRQMNLLPHHAIAESYIIFAKYFPFLQLHVEGFQV